MNHLVPPCNFEEHGAYEWHPPVDWGAAEGVPCLQCQGDVLYHLRKKLEVVQVIQRVQVVILAK